MYAPYKTLQLVIISRRAVTFQTIATNVLVLARPQLTSVRVGIEELSNFSASTESKLAHRSYFFEALCKERYYVYCSTDELRRQLRKGFGGTSDPQSAHFFVVSLHSQ